MSKDNKLAVTVGGIRWAPFTCEFKTQEGVFTFEIYAVDGVHAMERLEELKQTAVVTGELFGRVPAGEQP